MRSGEGCRADFGLAKPGKTADVVEKGSKTLTEEAAKWRDVAGTTVPKSKGAGQDVSPLG